MSMSRTWRLLAMASVLAIAHASTAWAEGPRSDPDTSHLSNGFASPPASARPRVWWHWLNGNISADGALKDLDWFASIGIGGVQNFDANLTTPRIVDKRLIYMQADWKEAFRKAVLHAQDKGLEFAIAASPGWSETGGPWVPPQDGMKKIVWTEMIVPGGKRYRGPIAPPPSVTGPYQTLHVEELFTGPTPEKRVHPQAGGDIVVLAVPVSAGVRPVPTAAMNADGVALSLDALTDEDPETDVKIPAGTASDPAGLTLTLKKPTTISSVRLFIKNAQPPFAPPRYLAKLQGLVDGNWRDVADVPLSETATTASFDSVTASQFRLLVSPNAPFVGGGLGSVPGAVIIELFPAQSLDQIAVGQFQLFAEPRVSQAEAKAGFSTVPNYAAIATKGDPVGVAPEKVIDITGKLRADGTLDWAPPKGSDWRILRFGWSLTGKTNHPAPPEATGLEVDKYDAAAVERYLRHYLSIYRETVGAENIGTKGIRAILTDSIEVGASNWTPRLLEEFHIRRGYDPRPWLPTLAGAVIGSGARSDKFLSDYRRTLAELMSEAHYGTIARVAKENGLTVYGEALEDGRPVLGDDLDMRRYADVPMAALWTYARDGKPRPGLLGDMKGAASVAHFYGKNFVAAESMTSAFSPWAFAPSDLKRVVDLEFASGVNQPVIHTSVHHPDDQKLPGLSLAIFGQYFNRFDTWAGMAKPWIDYIARSSFMLQQGVNVADVAIFYGEDTPVSTLYSRGIPPWLPRKHAFDFVNASMLAQLTVRDGGAMVSPGGAAYRVLQLAGTSSHMSVATLREIRRLAAAGVRIVGRPPVASPGLLDRPEDFDALMREIWAMPTVMAEDDIDAAMDRINAVPDVMPLDTNADLRFVHRQVDGTDIYFVNNREQRSLDIDVRFRVAGKVPELWSAIDGRHRELGYRSDANTTTVPLRLDPEDAVFVVFRRQATASSAQAVQPALRELASISGDWKVTFDSKLTPVPALTMKKLEPLHENASPAVRYFSGVASYTTTISRPAGLATGDRVWLDLGRVGDVAEVMVNGKSAGIAWFPPYRVDVGSLLKAGRNLVEVKVANLWVNRLIGDQQPGMTKSTWTAVPTYLPDAPLRPSGLIGPVRLIAENTPR